MTTKQILADLCLLEDAPWKDLKGKPISDNQLARRLKQYGVKSKTLRLKDELFAKGYASADLHDAWRRYLPPSQSPDKPVTAVTPVTSQSLQGPTAPVETARASSKASPPVAGEVSVTPSATRCDGPTEQRNPDETGVVTPVTPVTPFPENGGDAFEVVGHAPPGHRCYFCGKAGDVRLVRRQGDGEVDQAHLACAEQAWGDPQPYANDEPPPPEPCAYCGQADGTVYQTNDLRAATEFDRNTGDPRDAPTVPLHADCVQAFFAAAGTNGGGEPGTVASVPFMITRAMRQQLRDRNYTDEQISTLTPQQAIEILEDSF